MSYCRFRIFVKCYKSLPFAKNIGKNIVENISKNLSGQYCEKLLGHAENSIDALDAFKTSFKRVIQKTAESIVDLISGKIANQITKISIICNKIIQKHLQMSMMKKYLKKIVYQEKKDKNY